MVATTSVLLGQQAFAQKLLVAPRIGRIGKTLARAGTAVGDNEVDLYFILLLFT